MAEKDTPAHEANEISASRQMGRLTRRAFALGGGASAAGLAAWYWLGASAKEDGVSWPLRRMLRFNQRVAEATFSPVRLAPEWNERYAGEPRVNGKYGLKKQLDLANWRLKIENPATPTGKLFVTLEEIKSLPRFDSITELMCIEGWSQVVHWSGARLIDLMTRFRLGTRSGLPPDPRNSPQDLLKFAGLATPDREYYVGLDMPSVLHPQTMLCYEMNGESLTEGHGAPLRLVIPVKYGIKNLKRIGVLRFSDDRPADYWARRGYDWYAGL